MSKELGEEVRLSGPLPSLTYSPTPQEGTFPTPLTSLY